MTLVFRITSPARFTRFTRRSSRPLPSSSTRVVVPRAVASRRRCRWFVASRGRHRASTSPIEEVSRRYRFDDSTTTTTPPPRRALSRMHRIASHSDIWKNSPSF